MGSVRGDNGNTRIIDNATFKHLAPVWRRFNEKAASNKSRGNLALQHVVTNNLRDESRFFLAAQSNLRPLRQTSHTMRGLNPSQDLLCVARTDKSRVHRTHRQSVTRQPQHRPQNQKAIGHRTHLSVAVGVEI